MAADDWRERGWGGSAVWRLPDGDGHPALRIAGLPFADWVMVPTLRETQWYPLARAEALAEAFDAAADWMPPPVDEEQDAEAYAGRGWCTCLAGGCAGDCRRYRVDRCVHCGARDVSQWPGCASCRLGRRLPPGGVATRKWLGWWRGLLRERVGARLGLRREG